MADYNNTSPTRSPVVNGQRTQCVFVGVTFLVVVCFVPFVRSRPGAVVNFVMEDDSEGKSEERSGNIGSLPGEASESLVSLHAPAAEGETTQTGLSSTTTHRAGGWEVNTATLGGQTVERFLASDVESSSSAPAWRRADKDRRLDGEQPDHTALRPAVPRTASSLEKLSSQPEPPDEAVGKLSKQPTQGRELQQTSFQQTQDDDHRQTPSQQVQADEVKKTFAQQGKADDDVPKASWQHEEEALGDVNENVDEEDVDEPPYNWIDFSDGADSCGIRNRSCSPFFASPCSRQWRKDQYEGNCDPSRRREIEGNWTRCGVLRPNDGTSHPSPPPCWCRGRAATCCGHLTAIPLFPREVLYLNFTNNSLTRLDEEVLAPLAGLQWLLLGLNNVAQVSSSAFRGLRSLKRLDLNYNYRRLDPQFPGLDPVNFTLAINELNDTLQALDINATSFRRHQESKERGFSYVLRNLRLPYLKVLLADDGDPLPHLRMSHIYQLQQLCGLSLGSRQIRKFRSCFNESSGWEDVKAWADDRPEEEGAKGPPCAANVSLPSLQVLDLYNNSLIDIPDLCFNTSGNWSVLPNLKELSLAVNAVVDPQREQFRCLRNLQSLALTGNSLKYLQKELFGGMPSLHSLDMRFTNVMIAEDEVFRHQNLSWLSIKSSNWFFDHQHDPCCISSAVFNGSSLDYADLSYNVFVYAKSDRVQEVLRPLAASTKKLLMAGVGLDRVPEVVVRDFQQLVVLDLQSNTLTSVPPDTFDHMPHLEYVDLSNNHLAVFLHTDVYDKLIGQKVSINLESNPFDCTCELLHFLNLYKNYRDAQQYDTSVVPRGAKFVGQRYHCRSPAAWNNHSLMELDFTVHNCLLSLYQEILVIVVCLLLVFGTLAYIVLYRYRWQVRFWLYALHMRLAQGNSGQRRPHARFSAFVSYCREDSNFVLSKLLPALERARHLQLCIHERDFLPGRYITQNVLEYMNQSRHILLVLSNAALKNDQCRFEFFLAQKFALIDRQIRITALVLENLDSQLLDVHVVTLLHVSPSLRWPGAEEDPNPHVEESFWCRLGQTLGSKRVLCNHHRGHRLLPGGAQRLKETGRLNKRVN